MAPDLMPGAVGAGSFWKGMVDYSGGKSAQAVADDIQKSWDALKIIRQPVTPARTAGLCVAAPGMAGCQPPSGSSTHPGRACAAEPARHGLIGPSSMTDSIFQTLLAVVLSIGFVPAVLHRQQLAARHHPGAPDCARPRSRARARGVRPWLFLAPALLLLGVYLVYPCFETLRLSFMDATGTEFVGMANYAWVLMDENFVTTIRNNFLWLSVRTALPPPRWAWSWRCWLIACGGVTRPRPWCSCPWRSALWAPA